jgi:hypothetical protein
VEELTSIATPPHTKHHRTSIFEEQIQQSRTGVAFPGINTQQPLKIVSNKKQNKKHRGYPSHRAIQPTNPIASHPSK